MNDPIGQAIDDYYKNGKAENLIVETNYTEDEHLAPAYFFRTWQQMSAVEKTALNHCRGKVLDVGAAAGCHSLILQKRKIDVTALDKSKLAAEVMKKRAIKKVICSDLFDYNETGFDTIVALMNGTGIGGTVEGLRLMLMHLKNLLTGSGRILIDSSDISYLFKEEDGSVWIDLTNTNYYGEMEYKVKYKNLSTVFNWLYIDFLNLKSLAKSAGFGCELLVEGKHFDYLAQLTIKRSNC